MLLFYVLALTGFTPGSVVLEFRSKNSVGHQETRPHTPQTIVLCDSAMVRSVECKTTKILSNCVISRGKCRIPILFTYYQCALSGKIRNLNVYRLLILQAPFLSSLSLNSYLIAIRW